MAEDGSVGPSTMRMFEAEGDKIIGLWHFDAPSTMAARETKPGS